MSKKVTAEDLVASAWAAALNTQNAAEKVPVGWHTSRELRAILGKSESRMGELLREAVLSGKCEKRLFRIAAAGTVRPVPHYKLKQ